LGDSPFTLAIGVASDEAVATKVGVVAVAGKQVPGDHQDRVAHCDRRLLPPDAAGQPPVLRRQVGVAAAGSGPDVKMTSENAGQG
jgi:hypothetical protein